MTSAPGSSEGGPGCVECGRCCFDPRADYLPVFHVDLDRMGLAARAHTRQDADGRHYMNQRDGHCEALSVDIDAGRFECSIYGERPDVCRALARGSSACLEKVALIDPAALVRSARATPAD